MFQALGTLWFRFLQKKSKEKFHACVPFIEFIDWRYSSYVGISTQLCELLPPSTFSPVIWSMQNNLDNFVTEHKSMDKKLVLTLRLRRSGRRERPQCCSAGQRSHRPFHSDRQNRRRVVGTACLGRHGRRGRRGRRTPEFRSRRLVVRCPGTGAPV